MGSGILAKLIKHKDCKQVSETFEASYLVGADGARARHCHFLEKPKEDATSVVGDLCVEIEGIDRYECSFNSITYSMRTILDVSSSTRHFFGNRAANFSMLFPNDRRCPRWLPVPGRATNREREKLMFRCMSELVGRDISVRKVVFASEFRKQCIDHYHSLTDPPVDAAQYVHLSLYKFHLTHAPQRSQPNGRPRCGRGSSNMTQPITTPIAQPRLETRPSHKGLSPVALLDFYTPERLPAIAEMLNITTGIFHQIRTTPTIVRAMGADKR
ncbi:hypothetical protein JVU11DRAFT_2238 [Chiua virens]|nr:hypothetical protein JVU11DRAFT_2238 [Chiua virens]